MRGGFEHEVTARFRRAAARWELTDPEVLCLHASKAVLSANSRHFGPVILKLDRNRIQLRSEYEMLARLDGRGSCKAYAFDESGGLLLEERILPGAVLRREPSMEIRIDALFRVFRDIHVRGECRESYLDWLEEICQFCRDRQVPGELRDKAFQARDICGEIFAKYPERVVLHGDLHHDNLLRRTDGSYAMTDPKGVLGPEILDLPRFLLNELDTPHADPDERHLETVIHRMAERFGYSRGDLGRLFFMEAVLANIWCLEDGEAVNRRQMELADKILAICQ